MRPLWRYVNKIINSNGKKEQISLNETSVIFGISEGTNAENCIILLAKQFIVTCKLGVTCVSPYVEKFKVHLKGYIEMEKLSAQHKNKIDVFQEKWGFLIETEQFS